jgi:predicted DNA-binding protein
MFTVRLPKELEARLDKTAMELGVSKSSFARDAITNCIPKWEDELLARRQRTAKFGSVD